MSKIFIIAGEASGDLHGGNLIKEMKSIQPELQFLGWGGELMESAGCTIKKDYKELAFMGFIEVLQNIFTIFRNFSQCKAQITAFKPDALVLIDYPGFNLRMAKWAKTQNIKVYYYISPQIWAWKKGRIKTIKKYVDFLYAILPFEKEYYNNRDFYKVDYFGHPLKAELDEFKAGFEPEKFLQVIGKSERFDIALLPGSRAQEIKRIMPVLAQFAAEHKELKLCVALKENLNFEKLNITIPENTTVISGKTREILCSSRFAFVASGTATLETGLLGVPQIVCYKASGISYAIAKRLIKVKYISLVNLILNQQAIPELIQNQCTSTFLWEKYQQLTQENERLATQRNYALLNEKLKSENVGLQISKSLLKKLKEQ